MRPLFVCRANATKFMLHVARGFKQRGRLESACALSMYYPWQRAELESFEGVTFQRIYDTDEILTLANTQDIDHGEIERIQKEYGHHLLWNTIFREPGVSLHTHPMHFAHSALSYEQILAFVQAAVGFSERLLDDNKIDCIIDFAPAGWVRGILDHVAQSRGIPYLWPQASLAADFAEGERYFIVQRTIETYDFVERRYDELLAQPQAIQEGWEALKQFRESGKPVYGTWKRLEDERTGAKRVRFNSLAKWPLRVAYSALHEIRTRRRFASPEVKLNFHLQKTFWTTKTVSRAKGIYKQFYAKHVARFSCTAPTGKYAFMTLHYQPESSTSGVTPFQVNQVAVVENVARCLPLDWKLVVKPNKTMIRMESPATYRQLTKIPNVVVMDFDANTRKLLEGARAVVAISGTSGFEGALLGKPVAVFGGRHVVWGRLKQVRQIDDWRDLAEMFANAHRFVPDDTTLAGYLQALFDTTFSLKHPYHQTACDLNDPGYREGLEISIDAFINKFDEIRQCTQAQGQNG